MSVDLLPPPALQPKTEGVRHVFAAASYSFAGFRWMLGETAFRHELLGAAATLCAFGLAGVRAGDYVVQIGLMLMLFAVEALNTAVERIVDRVSPELSAFAKEAKDLGSFAVFCLLATNALFALFVLVRAL
jgi:diacylglycerol kinase (ATP)